jgi:flagellar hook-basal body complex protein FliE
MTVPSIFPLADIPFAGSTTPTRQATAGAQAAAGTPDFASVLSDMASQAVSSVRGGEDMAIKGLQGQAPVQDVVQAVMKAQTSLQTALALRDKAVTAYQDITRMPI